MGGLIFLDQVIGTVVNWSERSFKTGLELLVDSYSCSTIYIETAGRESDHKDRRSVPFYIDCWLNGHFGPSQLHHGL